VKRFIIGTSLTASLLLAGCAEESSREPKTEAKAEDKTEAAAPKKAEAVKKESNVEKTKAGEKTTYFTNKSVNEKVKLGPINFSLNKIQTSRLKVANTYKETFNNKEEVTLVVLDMTAENTSDDTNTGEQIKADIILSDDIGGEFIGKVKKTGNVFFLAEAEPKEITSIKFIVDGPSDSNFESLAERYTVEIPTK